MRAAADAGDRVVAVRWFRRLRDELTGLGLRPAEATLDLLAEISRGPAVAVAGLPDGEIVGRDAQLAAGRAALDQATAGRGEALWITGPPGIGKTRLAEALLSEARERGLHTIRGGAHADQEEAPYRPVVAALEPLLAERPELTAQLPEPSQRTLDALVGAGRHARGPDPPQGERHRIFTAVRQLLHHAAREHGLVMLIDDLHAADAATVQLLQHLARTADRHRLLLLLTARDGMPASLASVRAALVRDRSLRAIDLGPLGAAGAAALAEHAAGWPLPAAAAQTIAASAGGIPLYVEELAAAAGPGGEVVVPTRIADVLAPVLDRAVRAAADLLRWIAVADESFSAAELAALAELDEQQVAALLDATTEAGLLKATPRGHRIRHPLFAEALQRRVPADDLAAAHLRAADVLRAEGAAPERIAHHLLRGGEAAEAVPLLVSAAEWAASVAAFGDGQRWLEQALEHADPDERPELLALLASLRARTGDARAARTYQAAVTAAGGAELARLRLEQARAQLGIGDVGGAQRTLARVDPRTDAERGLLALYQGCAAWYSGDFQEAQEHADTAAPLIEDAGIPDATVKLHELRAMLAHAGGHWADHMHWQLGEVWTLPEVASAVFDAYLCVTEFALITTPPDEALKQYATQLRAHARRAGARRGEAYATTVLGEAALVSGDLRTAAATLAEAIRLSREVGAVGGESLARIRLGETLLHMGERDAARAEVDEALDLTNASSLGEHLLYIAHSVAVRLPEDPREGAALVERAEEVVDRTSNCDFCPVGWWATGAAVAARGDDIALSRSLVERAEAGARLRTGAAWRGAVAEAHGEIAAAESDVAAARDHLGRAADTYAAAGNRLSERRARIRLEQLTLPASRR
jgi:tetratricopeptide (TPR) repeat protein